MCSIECYQWKVLTTKNDGFDVPLNYPKENDSEIQWSLVLKWIAYFNYSFSTFTRSIKKSASWSNWYLSDNYL